MGFTGHKKLGKMNFPGNPQSFASVFFLSKRKHTGRHTNYQFFFFFTNDCLFTFTMTGLASFSLQSLAIPIALIRYTTFSDM